MGKMYSLFGLRLHSEIRLPELFGAEDRGQEADITIRVGKTPENLETVKQKNPWCQAGNREILLRVDGIARYTCSAEPG